MSLTSVGQDVFLSKEKFELGRNFANKIWNASRFVLMNLKPENIKVDLCEFYSKENLGLPERWILSKFYSLVKNLNSAYENFRFNEAANLLYEFFWHDFCDWYVEITKQNIENKATQVVLYKILEKFLRLLHPLMPFITEEIWHQLPHAEGFIMNQAWPHIQEQIIDKSAETTMENLFEITSAIRNLKADLGLQQAKNLKALIFSLDKDMEKVFTDFNPHITKLAAVDSLQISYSKDKPKHSAVAVLKSCEICLPLEGVVDFALQAKKIEEKLKFLENDLNSRKRKLENKDFVEHAPKEVVEKEKSRLEETREMITKLKKVKDALR